MSVYFNYDFCLCSINNVNDFLPRADLIDFILFLLKITTDLADLKKKVTFNFLINRSFYSMNNLIVLN